jgi:predicted DNA-binding transcriptional regulator YafY
MLQHSCHLLSGIAGIVDPMRASRLLALLLELERRGRATAEMLAAELEVSIRTIYRDVAALQGAGVPIWTETGPNGGIRLLEGWSGHLSGLTADEASALTLAGAPGVAAELGLGALAAAAQAKVTEALPPELRARATRMQERFLLDAPGWFHRPDPAGALPVVADAVWSGTRLDLTYRRSDRSVRRRVDPLGLVMKAGTWYLVAAHRGQPRTYRVGRISRARTTTEHIRRPDGFDLAAWWAVSGAEFDRSLLRAQVRVRLDPVAIRSLPHVVGPTSASIGLAGATAFDADGWRELTLPVESIEVARAQLVQLGDGVEVLDPPQLRAELARVGAAMAARNATPPPA